MSYFFLFLIALSAQPQAIANADESSATVRLDPISVNASASFESLSDDTFLPVEKVKLNQDHGSVVDQISKSNVFPVQNQGYPSGVTAINLGGRSIEDTQVFTLGVPLNLPQGGGADLSFFPDFLWSEADISPGLSSAGFSPAAASGSLQLKPWTREIVRDSRYNGTNSNFPVNRVTATYDRQVQSYSAGTKTENLAIVAGATSGLTEGPAGSLSYYLLHTEHNHLLIHVLGSQQKGVSPGSLNFATPDAQKKDWRIIPVLESHQEIDNLIIESTLYADFQSIVFDNHPKNDPTSASVTDERTGQYGIENAILYGAYTLGLSARFTQFENDGYFYPDHSTTKEHEIPMNANLTRDFSLSDRLSAKVGASVTKVGDVPLAPGGKISAKYDENEKDYFFSELSTTPKMPTLVERYFVDGTFYVGNPNLRPERVNSFLAGYSGHLAKEVQSTTTFKAEYRTDTQVDTPYNPAVTQTTVNAGNSYLFYVKQDFGWNWNDTLRVDSVTLLSHSQLLDTHLPYPNLPYFSQQLLVDYLFTDAFSVNTAAKYMGPSIEYNGNLHADYFLLDAGLSWQVAKQLRISGGLENIFDNRAQVVLGYPLPGRLIYLSMVSTF